MSNNVGLIFPTICIACIGVARSFSLPIAQSNYTRDGYEYLGSLKSINPVDGKFSDTSYFVSSRSYDKQCYLSATNDCIAIWPHLRSGLLEIETVEEHDFVVQMIYNKGHSGTKFWMGGIYDAYRQSWRWESGLPFSSWAPLASASGPFNTESRAGIHVTSLTIVQWNGFDKTDLMSFICEIKN